MNNPRKPKKKKIQKVEVKQPTESTPSTYLYKKKGESGKNKLANQIDLKNDNSSQNEEYIPYSCIPKLEKNDLSFNSLGEK